MEVLNEFLFGLDAEVGTVGHKQKYLKTHQEFVSSRGEDKDVAAQ